MDIMIKLENVSKEYKNIFALKEINLEIAGGEFVSITGPSGSGKTTLLNMVGCLDKPTAGQVLIDGTDVRKLNSSGLTDMRRNKIGLIFQQHHLVPHLNALENVLLAQHYHSIPDLDEATEALDKVGLKDRLTHYPEEMSGGEQQRVCIARALINKPKIILADEPTGNLDAENEKIVLNLLKALSDDGHILLMVTHNLEISKLAHRNIELNHGEIVSSDWA